MLGESGQEPSASVGGVRYSLVDQSDGRIFVRAFGSELKSAVIGPFIDVAAAWAWIGEPPALHCIKRRQPGRPVRRAKKRRILSPGLPI
jgi:hypothetical protein